MSSAAMMFVIAAVLLMVEMTTANEGCGQPVIQHLRVIGGKPAIRGSWPWQILMMHEGKFTCGGAIISPRWVITAAHCVFSIDRFPESFSVRVGEYDRDVFEGTEEDMEVEKVIKHPGYHPFTLSNDIALLKLKKPIAYTKYVKPVCLPTSDLPPGKHCYITGWGKMKHPGPMSQILQQGRMPIVSNEECQKKNRKVTHVQLTPEMLCAGDGGETRLSGCHGDSGGPFVCHVNGRWELHGAVSYGNPTCSSSKAYTVFCRINRFKGWIQGMMMTN